MRFVTFLVVLLCTAGVAIAENPEFKTSTVPFNFNPNRDSFYSQVPTSMNALNASSGFGSETVDGIPPSFAGTGFNEVTFFHAQWGTSDFRTPDALVVTIYDESCPPSLDPSSVFVIPYADLSTELLYDDSWYVYAITAILPETVIISDSMSIGAYIEASWGTDNPMNGLCMVDVENGTDCCAYWDGTYWGFDRWTALTDYSGIFYDLAYILGARGTVATEPASWGTIKSIFR